MAESERFMTGAETDIENWVTSDAGQGIERGICSAAEADVGWQASWNQA